MKISLAFPLIAIVLIYMALKAIKKDEKIAEVNQQDSLKGSLIVIQ